MLEQSNVNVTFMFLKPGEVWKISADLARTVAKFCDGLLPATQLWCHERILLYPAIW